MPHLCIALIKASQFTMWKVQVSIGKQTGKSNSGIWEHVLA